MCYNISFTTNIEDVEIYLPGTRVDKEVKIKFEPTPHVQAQTFSNYPILLREDGQLKCKLMEWGVVPPYMKTVEDVKKGRATMCNARSEKIVDDHKSYWHRIRHQRCLIPVTGIFEHREIKGWKKKVPYYIRQKHRGIYAIPGLYNYSHIPTEDGELRGTFTMITRPANDVMKQIHNGGPNAGRMVMFLPDKTHEEHWLVPDLSDADMNEVFSYALPEEKLAFHPVYTLPQGYSRPDGKDYLDEFKWEGLPPLGEDAQKALF